MTSSGAGVHQDIRRPRISLANASIQCTAMGGDHNKDTPSRVGCGSTEFIIIPPPSTVFALEDVPVQFIILGVHRYLFSKM